MNTKARKLNAFHLWQLLSVCSAILVLTGIGAYSLGYNKAAGKSTDSATNNEKSEKQVKTKPIQAATTNAATVNKLTNGPTSGPSNTPSVTSCGTEVYCLANGCINLDQYETEVLQKGDSVAYELYQNTKQGYLQMDPTDDSSTQNSIDEQYQNYKNSLVTDYLDYASEMAKEGCDLTAKQTIPLPE